MIDDVIELLENSSEGSRELDAKVAIASGNVPEDTNFWRNPFFAGRYSDGNSYIKEVPKFTTSLDATRKLSDWVWLVASDIAADGLGYVKLGNPLTSTEVSGIHSKLEIAACIAALKSLKEG